MSAVLGIPGSLLAKELRQLLPVIGALLALSLTLTGQQLLFEPAESQTWSNYSFIYNADGAGVMATVMLAIGIVVAYMMFPGEQDRRTLEFLWALPGRRSSIFIGKVAVAVAVLLAFSLFDYLLTVGMLQLNDNSFARAEFSWSMWRLELAMTTGVTLIGFCYGALISVFRLLGVVFAVILLLIVFGISRLLPTWSIVDPTELLTVEFVAGSIVVPVRAWLLHAAVAFGVLLLAARLWTRRGDSVAGAMARLASSTGGRVVKWTLISVGSGLLALVLLVGLEQQTAVQQDTMDDISGRMIETEYYRIHFQPSHRYLAQAAAQEADTIFAGLSTLFDAGPMGKIIADVSDNSAAHLGVAGWKKVRINSDALIDANLRTHVIAHETAHVFAASESRLAVSRMGQESVFFNEGLAEWATYETQGLVMQRSALRDLAAAMWLRHELKFPDLVFASSFGAQYDGLSMYALGESWVSAMAQVCGSQSVGAALRAMGRDDAPQQLDGVQLYRDTLQHIGCDLDKVNGIMALNMRAREQRVAEIPRVIGGVTRRGDNLVFTAMLVGGLPAEDYRVLFKMRESASVSDTAIYSDSRRAQLDAPVEFEVPSAYVSGARFQFQFGVEFIADERPFFERWQTGAAQ